MKSKEQLSNVAQKIKRKYGIDFIIKDYAQKGGHQAQQQMAKQNQVYRQDYCGCIFGLLAQRAKKGEYKPDELYSSITPQILPASVEERIELYKKRDKLEAQNINYKIVKENFLNYRLLNGKISIKNKVIPSYILFYSYLEREISGRIELQENEIYHFNRMQIKFISLQFFNKLLDRNYTSILNIQKNPPTIQQEINIREKVLNSKYNLSPLIVLENIPISQKIEIKIDSKIYPDNKEVLILI